VIDDAHLSPCWLLEGITRFVKEREQRLKGLQTALDAARR